MLELEELKEMILQYVDVEADDVREDSRLIEDLAFNSYDCVCLLGEIEEKYDITVDEEDISDIHTVGDIINYVNSRK